MRHIASCLRIVALGRVLGFVNARRGTILVLLLVIRILSDDDLAGRNFRMDDCRTVIVALQGKGIRHELGINIPA